MSDITDELLKALATATIEQKKAMLRALRNESAKPSPPAWEPFLTLGEVARELKVSVRSLWRWRIPTHAFGSRRRCRLSEVVAYLESEEFRRRAEALSERRAGKKP